MDNIFVWTLKNYSVHSFKECLFFVLYKFCFLLLPNNTLHVMFCIYICYWNIFQYKYIIQITFHVVKQSCARVTSKSYLFTLFYIYHLFPFCLKFVLFHEAFLLLRCSITLVYSYVENSKHIYLLNDLLSIV